MTKQKNIEFESLQTAKDNAIKLPIFFETETANVINSDILKDWKESPDFLIKYNNFYIGIEHFQARMSTKKTENGKRINTLTSAWEEIENSRLVSSEDNILNDGQLLQALQIAQKEINRRVKTVSLPKSQLFEEISAGLLYSYNMHIKKLKTYIRNIKQKYDTDNIKMAFLIDLHIDLPIKDIRESLKFILSSLIEKIKQNKNNLSYLFVNFHWLENIDQKQHNAYGKDNIIKIIIDKMGTIEEKNISFGINLNKLF